MILPPELAADWDALSRRWTTGPLHEWLNMLPEQFISGLAPERYGDLPRWRTALASLPSLPAGTVQLNTPRVGLSGYAPDTTLQALETALMGLHPWRKGPFELFGLHIDTEWRRLLGAGAAEVIGIDPTPLFILQFKALQHYLQQPGIHVLPMALESMPEQLPAFDTVLSMGVLYHRRDPLAHLDSLKHKLVPGGQLVLETLVIEGDDQALLVPDGRYARMGNVWQLPSAGLVRNWLADIGFAEPRIIDVGVTSLEEQRRTAWMTFHSLEQFLNPADHSLTAEGLPAPRRALLVAQRPG